MQRWSLGALGTAAGAALLLSSLLAGVSAADAPQDTLAVPDDGRVVAGSLKQFDALANEAGCQTVGSGQAGGRGEVSYDAATRSLRYRVTLSSAQPNTSYLLDV